MDFVQEFGLWSGKIIQNQKTSAKRNQIFYLPPIANGVNFRRRLDHFLPSLDLHRPEKYQPSSSLFSFFRQDPEFPALLSQETGSGGGARHFRSEPRGRATRRPVSTVLFDLVEMITVLPTLFNVFWPEWRKNLAAK